MKMKLDCSPQGKRLERKKNRRIGLLYLSSLFIQDIYINMVSVVCNIGLYENKNIKKAHQSASSKLPSPALWTGMMIRA